MNSWKSGLNSALSGRSYMSAWPVLPIEVRMVFRVASWSHSALWAWWRFLRMCLSRLSLGRLFLVMLLGLGLAYGLSTSRADYYYALGMNESQPIKERIDSFRIAATYNPFDHNARTVGASLMGLVALQSHDQGWLEAARAEIRYRLQTDSTDAVLLIRGLLVNLDLKDEKEAQFYFDQFQRVDKKSPIIKQVEQAHIEGTQNVTGHQANVKN